MSYVPLSSIEPIVESIVYSGSTVIPIVAGHYCLNPDLKDLSSEAIPEESSFHFGIKLYKRLKESGLRAWIVVWVNDIGIDPNLRQQAKDMSDLPGNYMGILEQEGIIKEDFQSVCTVMFESTMRNRASVQLRKIYKRNPSMFKIYDGSESGLIRCIDNNTCSLDARSGQIAYAVISPDGKDLVVKDGPNPKCNLILASLFDRLASNQGHAVHIVNMFNEIYIHRINLGVHVHNMLFANQLTFTNIFSDACGHIWLDNAVSTEPELCNNE